MQDIGVKYFSVAFNRMNEVTADPTHRLNSKPVASQVRCRPFKKEFEGLKVLLVREYRIFVVHTK